jgi:hypothetical protein
MRFRDDGECWDLSISGEKPKERLYLGAHFGADALALNIYTGAVKIDFEHVDTDEIYYSHSED